jgi:3'-phosphoadenosine 5'-phosphosulfate (PAPS) 3'-phosphatase
MPTRRNQKMSFRPLVLTLALLRASSSAFPIGQLLSTCIDACERGCHEIRHIHATEGASGELKDATDARSVLTKADRCSQKTIVECLQATWGPDLHIVGEEDEADIPSDLETVNKNLDLAKDWLDDDIGETADIPAEQFTIFVDPLDGTREFVEGRLENCQVLVGIALDGQAVAGAIGIPFASEEGPTIVYGLEDVGTGVRGPVLTRGPFPLEKYVDGMKYPRPHHAVGDNPVPTIQAAAETVIGEVGGSTVTYGGAGNKILATALSEVSSSLQHKVGGPWDTCAPEAIARAMGAEITNLFGEPISMYGKDPPPRANEQGFAITCPGTDHSAFMRIVLKTPAIQKYRKEVLTNEALTK